MAELAWALAGAATLAVLTVMLLSTKRARTSRDELSKLRNEKTELTASKWVLEARLEQALREAGRLERRVRELEDEPAMHARLEEMRTLIAEQRELEKSNVIAADANLALRTQLQELQTKLRAKSEELISRAANIEAHRSAVKNASEALEKARDETTRALAETQLERAALMEEIRGFQATLRRIERDAKKLTEEVALKRVEAELVAVRDAAVRRSDFIDAMAKRHEDIANERMSWKDR